jgi:hypothetical protein
VLDSVKLEGLHIWDEEVVDEEGPDGASQPKNHIK